MGSTASAEVNETGRSDAMSRQIHFRIRLRCSSPSPSRRDLNQRPWRSRQKRAVLHSTSVQQLRQKGNVLHCVGLRMNAQPDSSRKATALARLRKRISARANTYFFSNAARHATNAGPTHRLREVDHPSDCNNWCSRWQVNRTLSIMCANRDWTTAIRVDLRTLPGLRTHVQSDKCFQRIVFASRHPPRTPALRATPRLQIDKKPFCMRSLRASPARCDRQISFAFSAGACPESEPALDAGSEGAPAGCLYCTTSPETSVRRVHESHLSPWCAGPIHISRRSLRRPNRAQFSIKYNIAPNFAPRAVLHLRLRAKFAIKSPVLPISSSCTALRT